MSPLASVPVLQCSAVWCNALQCVAVCLFSVLQCVGARQRPQRRRW